MLHGKNIYHWTLHENWWQWRILTWFVPRYVALLNPSLIKKQDLWHWWILPWFFNGVCGTGQSSPGIGESSSEFYWNMWHWWIFPCFFYWNVWHWWIFPCFLLEYVALVNPHLILRECVALVSPFLVFTGVCGIGSSPDLYQNMWQAELETPSGRMKTSWLQWKDENLSGTGTSQGHRDWPTLSYREQYKEGVEEADSGNDGKTTSKSGLDFNGTIYCGKLRTAKNGESWL